MKKTLSLLLAVLMLASLAVTASASSVLDGFITDTYRSKTTTSPAMKSLYSIISEATEKKSAVTDPYYTAWYDNCPECKGVALFYVKGGNVCWQCLEDDCDKSGVITFGSSDDKKDDKDDKKEETVKFDGRCPDCGSARHTVYLQTVVRDGKLVDQYYCGRCGELFYVNSAEKNPADVKCTAKNCTRTAKFTSYSMTDGKLYANYKCADGHTFGKLVGADEDEEYRIKVICDHGEYDIRGGSYAEYGEKKTVYFEADDGYILTEVVINGSAVSFKDNKVTFTVEGNTTIRAAFEKKNTQKTYTITASVKGGGKISVMKNDVKVSADKVEARSTDTVTYRFNPSSSRYTISDVKVDGKSVGTGKSLTFTKLNANHTVEVTFKWNSPYSDVKDTYSKAVEYVTEAGVMGALKTTKTGLKTTYSFCGAAKVSVKQFAAALAEMADVNDKLSTVDKRVEWAKNNGVVGKNQDLSANCDVQTACVLVKNYLTAVEKLNKIDFTAVKAKDSVKETAVKIGMVTEKTYEKNRELNRYDLAAVCYMISGLDY